MRPRRKKVRTARIYTKQLADSDRPAYYGDFRIYRAVGGKQEALRAPEERLATTDRQVAQRLFAARLAYYVELASRPRSPQADADRTEHTYRRPFPRRLHEAFALHLQRRAESGKRTKATLIGNERQARTLLRILGDRELASLTADDLTAYVEARRGERNPKTHALISPRTILNEITTLRSLCKRARVANVMTHNPFKGWDDCPRPATLSRNVLTRDNARRLMAAAEAVDAEARQLLHGGWDAAPRHAPVVRGRGQVAPPVPPRLHDTHAAIIATMLYTGGRLSEVLGLDVGDLDFEKAEVWFRENRYRGLKRDWCHRAVPMPPPLHRRLEAHVRRLGLRQGQPLFHGVDAQTPMKNPSKLVRRCAARAGLPTTLTAHALRHTFATAMMTTYVRHPQGHGIARSSWDVAKLLGHKRSDLVETVYAHWTSHMEYAEELDFEPRDASDVGAHLQSGQNPSKHAVTTGPDQAVCGIARPSTGA